MLQWKHGQPIKKDQVNNRKIKNVKGTFANFKISSKLNSFT